MLFVIARGDFVALVNGHEVSNKADWGDFDRKDITTELVRGQNTVELRLTSHAPFALGTTGEVPSNRHCGVVEASERRWIVSPSRF